MYYGNGNTQYGGAMPSIGRKVAGGKDPASDLGDWGGPASEANVGLFNDLVNSIAVECRMAVFT